jgi:hypothetical protein
MAAARDEPDPIQVIAPSDVAVLGQYSIFVGERFACE